MILKTPEILMHLSNLKVYSESVDEKPMSDSYVDEAARRLAEATEGDDRLRNSSRVQHAAWAALVFTIALSFMWRWL